MKEKIFDVAIVGGGPAGLSCGLWLGRYLRDTVLIDAGDPRNWETTGVNGFLGLPKVKPAELRERGRAELRHYDVELIDGQVQRVGHGPDEAFILELEGGSLVRARRMVLAIGMVDLWPDCPGLEHCYGRSAHHCPDCDGYETRGQQTVVVGHGRKAAALALALSNWTDQIIICTNGNDAHLEQQMCDKLKALNIPIVETKIKMAHSVERYLKYLELTDGMQIDAEKLFFAVDHLPADDLGKQLGCDRDEEGLIIVDSTMRTSVEHVFAAGDITPGPQMVVRAAADGAVAAAAVHRSLLPESRRV